MKINPEHVAFPLPNQDLVGAETGLTKREYIAAMALQGLLSNPNIASKWPESLYKEALKVTPVCDAAVQQADALIKALSEDVAG